MNSNRTKIKLICGPAKSGKTSYVIKSFVENIEKNPCLIIPSSEMLRRIKHSIFSEFGFSGFLGSRIFTFDNLVNLVVEDINELSHTGKNYLLRDIVDNLDLKYFQPIKKYSGFYSILSSFISELKQGQIMPNAFLQKLQKKGINNKDKELSYIYSAYQKKLNKLNIYDHEGKFWQAQKILETAQPKFLSNCKLLLVDGFQNFNPTELNLIDTLAIYIEKVIITLTLDKNNPQPEIFGTTAKTYIKIKETFNNIEEMFLPKIKIKQKKTVVIACPGQEREAEEIAKKIKKALVENNARPADIVVIFRTLADYREIISTEFKRHGIPYSISESSLLKESPAVKCIMGIFDIIQSNWSRESVFNFLKSNYIEHKKSIDIDHIEQTCKEAGIIDGKDTYLSRLSPGLEKDYIEQFISVTQKMEENPGIPVLRELINYFGIASRIAASPDYKLLKQEISAYTKFIEGLEELKQNKFSNINAFYKYLRMMIDTTKYFLMHPDTNTVQLIDAHRARGLSFPIVFIGGLLEDRFPKQIKEESFYRDKERAEFRSVGINIEDAKEKQKEELFLFYTAVHTAEEQLYLTYPVKDIKGKEELPSHYIDMTKSIINTDLEYQKVHASDIIPQADSLYTRDYLFPGIILNIWKEQKFNKSTAMYNYFIQQNNSRFHSIIDNIFLENEERGILKEKEALNFLNSIFNKEYIFSVSQFNEYGICPFNYFCKRVLKLKTIKSPEEELNPADEGNLYHSILWDFYTTLREQRNGNTSINADCKDEAFSLIKAFAEKYFREIEKNEIINNPDLWKIKKKEIIKNLENMIFYEEQNNNPLRKPAYFEISFGMEKKASSDKASVTLPLIIGGVKLQGKIDRIDIIESNTAVPLGFIVIDYKSGAHTITPKDITDGINIQLPIYMIAAKDIIMKTAQPIEGYFWHIKNKKQFHHCPIAYYKKNKRNPKWDTYIEAAQKYVKEYAEHIQKGIFKIAPKKKCPPYCDYKNICRKGK